MTIHDDRPEERTADRGALAPSSDPARWERTVASIVAAAGPELSRRAELAAPWLGRQIAGWARPVLAAAAGLMLLATASFLVEAGAPGGIGSTAEAPNLEDALFPPVVASWLQTGAPPTVEEVVFSGPLAARSPAPGGR